MEISVLPAGQRHYWILAGIFALLALILIIITAVALNKDSVTCGTSEKFRDGRRVWSITLGHEFGANEYLNKTGHIVGFSVDLINAVCAAGDMICEIIWDDYSNCWDHEPGRHPVGGIGLHSGWYDACTAWAQTVARRQVFAFTQSHLLQPIVNFFVLKGNPMNFDGADISNIKKIGFLDGWASDAICLRNLKDVTGGGDDLTVDKVVYLPYPKDLADALVNRTVDVGFTTFKSLQYYVETEKTLDVISDKNYVCTVSGESMMSRKDSRFIAAWNKGLDIIKGNGVFRKICEQAVDDHGHKGNLRCVPT